MNRHFASIAVVGFILAVGSLALASATPKEAVGFAGSITGTVTSRADDGTSFRLKVSKAVADESKSKVKDTDAMIGKELTLGTRMPRTDGKAHNHPDDVAYIKSLKVGDEIVVQVFAVHSDPSVLRMTKPGEAAGK